jgi:hypothetical protein
MEKEASFLKFKGKIVLLGLSACGSRKKSRRGRDKA